MGGIGNFGGIIGAPQAPSNSNNDSAGPIGLKATETIALDGTGLLAYAGFEDLTLAQIKERFKAFYGGQELLTRNNIALQSNGVINLGANYLGELYLYDFTTEEQENEDNPASGGYIFSGLKMYGDPFAPASGQTNAGALAGFSTTYNVTPAFWIARETFEFNVYGGATSGAKFGLIQDANNYITVEIWGDKVVIKETVAGSETVLATISASTNMFYGNSKTTMYYGRTAGSINISGIRYTPNNTYTTTSFVSTDITRIGFANGGTGFTDGKFNEFSSQGLAFAPIT
jgi:hypothetical protein